MCITRISLGLVMTTALYAFDLKQEAHLRWTRDRSRVNWDEFVLYQRKANVVDAEAGRQFSVRSRMF